MNQNDPVHASSFLDLGQLSRLVETGYISRRDHPDAPLWIYNYTARCAYERAWGSETMAARGLILDHSGNVAARPFPKFFNLHEHPSQVLPQRWEAQEKMDGSLGIAYRHPTSGEIQIATRGAFASEQARWATTWWQRNAQDVAIPAGQTWLFEIIYPENRIVVDYGARAELVLLTTIDHMTGRDLPRPDWIGSTARVFSAETIAALVDACPDPGNFEGYVIRDLDTDIRIKVKLDEYVRLHRLLTEVTPRHIWEMLAAGDRLDPLLERVPDEFYDWASAWENRLRREYARIMSEAWDALSDSATDYRDRKATAGHFKTRQHLPVLFKLLDGKDPSALVWKMLRPAAVRGLRADLDAELKQRAAGKDRAK